MDARLLKNTEFLILLQLRSAYKRREPISHIFERFGADTEPAIKSLNEQKYAFVKGSFLYLGWRGENALDEDIQLLRKENPSWLADMMNITERRVAKDREEAEYAKRIWFIVFVIPFFIIVGMLLSKILWH